MKKNIKLNDGNSIPTLGLGTWMSEPGLVGEAVKYALDLGYTHVDCAAIYRNEKEIGETFKATLGKKIKRENIFVTSKLWNTHHNPKDVEKACKQTLKDLQLDYLDLYLMHWGLAFKKVNKIVPARTPQATEPISIQQTWQALESLVKKGLVKSIGVSNFTAMMIIDLLTYAKIKPVVNQIELHPYLPQEQLVKFCQKLGITITAYSPLGRSGVEGVEGPSLLDEEVIKKLSKKYKKTPAQVLLNWGLGRETVVIPKSTTPQRIMENTKIFDFELSKDEQATISALNKNYRLVDPKDWWGIPYFS